MAVTAVYANIARIPMSGLPGDSHLVSNVSATTGSFTLHGGRYAVIVVGATFGTLTLQILGADGTTWLTALTAFTASGTAVGDMPEGLYRWLLA